MKGLAANGEISTQNDYMMIYLKWQDTSRKLIKRNLKIYYHKTKRMSIIPHFSIGLSHRPVIHIHTIQTNKNILNMKHLNPVDRQSTPQNDKLKSHIDILPEV